MLCSTTIRYRNHWVDPRAYELLDGTGWTAEVYVAWGEGEDTIDRQFILKGKFATPQAATTAAEGCGKRQVDKLIVARDIQTTIDDAVT